MSDEIKKEPILQTSKSLSDTRTKNTDDALKLLTEHCPSIIEAVFGKDQLLKETAESALSWNVFAVSGGDINYALRALCDMSAPPLNKLESTEARFLELKRLIIKARGDADLDSLANETLRVYAVNIMSAIDDTTGIKKIKTAAEQALSDALLGHKSADFNFVKKYIADNLNAQNEKIVEKIKKAELGFIDTRALIESLINGFKAQEQAGSTAVLQLIQRGIAQYNIFFVLLLIIALAFSAEYLTQQALPLVAAAIGAASAHLLAERNTVLGAKSTKNENLEDRN